MGKINVGKVRQNNKQNVQKVLSLTREADYIICLSGLGANLVTWWQAVQIDTGHKSPRQFSRNHRPGSCRHRADVIRPVEKSLDF